MILRPIINGLLGLGYCWGFVLVWVGIRLIAFEHDKLAAGGLGVALGIGWWAGLVWVGKRVCFHHSHGPGCAERRNGG